MPSTRGGRELTARERLALLLDEGSFEEFDMSVPSPLHELRNGEAALRRRRRCHRTGHDRRPSGLCGRPGFHRFGRIPLKDYGGEDLQGYGSGNQERVPLSSASTTPAERESRKELTRSQATGKYIRKEYPRVRSGPADFRNIRSLRRRSEIFTPLPSRTSL